MSVLLGVKEMVQLDQVQLVQRKITEVVGVVGEIANPLGEDVMMKEGMMTAGENPDGGEEMKNQRKDTETIVLLVV